MADQDQNRREKSQDRRLDYLQNADPKYLNWLQELYEQNPDQVPFSWRYFFDGIGLSESYSANGVTSEGSRARQDHKAKEKFNEVEIELSLLELIEAYRWRGHLAAQINPLDPEFTPGRPNLSLSQFNLDKAPKDKKFEAARAVGLAPSTIPDLERHLKKTYCGSMGVQFMHISDQEVTSWLQDKMEPNANKPSFDKSAKTTFFQDIAQANQFEDFLQKNFTGQKRFSLEGAGALIPALKMAVRTAVFKKVKEIVVGMAHRGRLNVLVNVMKKSYSDVFSEFEGHAFKGDFSTSGDVKYHLGYSNDIQVGEQKVHISLSSNPSHLEAVDPVVSGMARAKQDLRYQGKPEALMPILIHGDAAVIGQGVVAETLNLSGLKGYSTGGTLHFIINNQIGFTTTPEDARSTLYCTDFAKAIQAPIFHVNGNDIEAVIHAVILATEFRMKFKRDVFIDVYCFRKYGHNEGDEPRFTHPVMYDRISKVMMPYEAYLKQLQEESVIDEKTKEDFERDYNKQLEEILSEVRKNRKEIEHDHLRGAWSKIRIGRQKDLVADHETKIDPKKLDEILEVIHNLPEDRVKPMRKFTKLLRRRYSRITKDDEWDWAIGEQVAFGSLLQEGYSVRLSGQDSIRGTFSQRHAGIFDEKTEKPFFPLKTLEKDSAHFQVYNSPLSEYAVLGFDYGYSTVSPQCLTLWEAQFGDFCNGAQIIIDQFIASSESKWLRLSGIVMLLPHGYEGQGPEHSSARLERFLQLGAEGNIQVAYPTTPAQYCHLLRRQMLWDFRKPLIVMTPKGPLRRYEVHSKRKDFIAGGFKPCLLSGASTKKSKRVILCSGKVYWDLKSHAEEKGFAEETTFVRVELLYPLPRKALEKIASDYGSVETWRWVQEEPENIGAWRHFRMHSLEWQGFERKIEFVGRDPSAGIATGSANTHQEEQDRLMTKAFS
jgi:2-oxoglutarate dehydrogenase E1 component